MDEVAVKHAHMYDIVVEYFKNFFSGGTSINSQTRNTNHRVIIEAQNAMCVKELEFIEFTKIV